MLINFNRTTSALSLKVNEHQRSPTLTNQLSTPRLQSPSSDYYSLSPKSPPPEDIQITQSGKGFPTSLEQHRSVSEKQPDNKSQASDDQTSNPDHNKQPAKNERSHGGREDQHDDVYSPNVNSDADKVSTAVQQRGSTGKKSGPFERDLKSGRRHSWAGDKKVPAPQKQTSLTDFKKLLAQQSTSQNPQRISAKELLQKPGGEVVEPFYSSQKLSGSFRKRPIPRKDHRFSVIQEETVEGSRENLLNGRP